MSLPETDLIGDVTELLLFTSTLSLLSSELRCKVSAVWIGVDVGVTLVEESVCKTTVPVVSYEKSLNRRNQETTKTL